MIDMNEAVVVADAPSKPATCGYVWTEDFSIRAVPCSEKELRDGRR
jgi:hypothetical protein